MCQFCGCGDYYDLDSDLHEMAEYDVDGAYAEQAYRDEQAERERREEAEWNADDSSSRNQYWNDQASIHEHIERYDENND